MQFILLSRFKTFAPPGISRDFTNKSLFLGLLVMQQMVSGGEPKSRDVQYHTICCCCNEICFTCSLGQQDRSDSIYFSFCIFFIFNRHCYFIESRSYIKLWFILSRNTLQENDDSLFVRTLFHSLFSSLFEFSFRGSKQKCCNSPSACLRGE